MQSLRNSKFIAGLVLVWFALFLGSAVTSAVLKPGSTQVICSAGGAVKIVDTGDDAKGGMATSGMDCPLCASVNVPLHNVECKSENPSPLAYALHPIAAAHITSLTAPPLPSRGPPTSFL